MVFGSNDIKSVVRLKERNCKHHAELEMSCLTIFNIYDF